MAGESVGGVIYQPFHQYTLNAGEGGKLEATGRCIWGIQGVGVFGHEKVKRAPGETELAETPRFDAEGSGGNENVICTTRSHSTGVVMDAVNACAPSKVVKAGGCGYKVLMLMESECHGYVFASPGCKKWDTCAPEALIRELGGELTDMHGDRLVYRSGVERPNRRGVLSAGTKEWHQLYLKRMPQSVLDAISK